MYHSGIILGDGMWLQFDGSCGPQGTKGSKEHAAISPHLVVCSFICVRHSDGRSTPYLGPWPSGTTPQRGPLSPSLPDGSPKSRIPESLLLLRDHGVLLISVLGRLRAVWRYP